MSDIAISVKNLTKVYKVFDKPIDRVKESLHPFGKRYSKDFYALNDVSFEIKKGETLGIIGKNGAGKSTLLKILTGVLTPSSGEVNINGKVASLLELGAGFNPDMTGRENIYLNGSLMGYSEEEMESRVPAIIEFADIGDFIDQPVKMYSSGMFARLAFSVNIAVEPDILIVDEALSVGDEFFQQKCIYKMKKMQQEGVTILFVSHAIGAVKALCDRCILMAGGKKIEDGIASAVCDIYQNTTTSNVKESNLSTVSNRGKISTSLTTNNIGLFRVDEDFEKRATERSGSMEIEFTAFDFYFNKKMVNVLPMDSIFRIAVSGIAHSNIPSGTAIGILCRNSMGIDVFVGNLNLYGIYLPEIKKDTKFVLEIEYDVNLAPGTYFWGVGAKIDPLGDYFYDRLFNAAKLEIYQKNPENGILGGIVHAKLVDYKMRCIE